MGGPIWAVSQIVTVFFGRVKDEVADGTVGGATVSRYGFLFLKSKTQVLKWGTGSNRRLLRRFYSGCWAAFSYTVGAVDDGDGADAVTLLWCLEVGFLRLHFPLRM